MSRGDWIQLAAVVALWVWLFYLMLKPDGLIDKQPPVCIGCERHFVKPGCPVHDSELRRAA